MNIYTPYQSVCKNGCGKNAIRFTKKGEPVCFDRPAECPVIKDKMQRTSLEKYGSLNPSSSPEVKEKRQQNVLSKYGVDNVSKSPAVKDKLSSLRREYWDEVYSHRSRSTEGLTKEQYRHRCQQYANTQYARFKDILDPDGLRGKHWHLDHIFSVSDGFAHDIPVEIISDITNLRIISDTENYKKHRISGKTIDQLYEDFAGSSVTPSHRK